MQVMSMTAPSSPRHFSGCFFSAPSSPRGIAEFYRNFDDTSTHDVSSKSQFVPFDWEQKPGTPKSPMDKISNPHDEDDEEYNDVDFAFDIGEKSEITSLFAEELFDGGQIKPLKPPPRLQLEELENFKKKSPRTSPRSPRSPISFGKNIIRKAFSPKKKPVDVWDPFETAIENARNGLEGERGRKRDLDLAHRSNPRAARSLSPFRVSAYPWEEEDQYQEKEQEEKKKQSDVSLRKKGSFSSTSLHTLSSVSSKLPSSRKWRLRDLLFRSASEGRGKHKTPIMGFSSLFKTQEDVTNSSFRSTEGSRKSSGSSVSAHGFHYMVKKEELKDMKKKTFLPYKQIGRFAF